MDLLKGENFITIKETQALVKKAEEAKELASKISNLKEFLGKLDKKKIRAGGITQEKIREPVEWSNDFCWSTFVFKHIDYEKLDALCQAEVKRQTLEQLKIAEKELANFSL